MLKYYISLVLVFFNCVLSAQKVEQDTVNAKHKYGLRICIDIFKPVQSLITPQKKLYEI